MKKIDCRNQACPAPVINVKKALEEFKEIQVYLDSGAPHENVARYSKNRGFSVTEQQDGNSWLLTICSTPDTKSLLKSTQVTDERILLISSDRFGDGPADLGRLLMKNFIHTLLESSELPSRIFFVNSGVLLTCEGSDVLEALEKLKGMGTEIFSCGLCLDFYGIKDKLQAGSTTNMLTIAECLMNASQVIKL